MPAAHIAGLPIEETLLMLAGPAAFYLVAVAVSLRATRRRTAAAVRRLISLPRHLLKPFGS